MLAAVSFGVGITTLTMTCLTTLLTGLHLLSVCHKILCTQGSMSLIAYTVCVRIVLRHSFLTRVLYTRYCVIQSLHKLCALGTASSNPFTGCVRKDIASFNPYTRFVLHIQRHPIQTQVVYARYCVIQSLHKFCTPYIASTNHCTSCVRKGIASTNPYTSCVRNVLRHSILTQVVYAKYCVIQSLHKLCTPYIASTNPYTSFVRNVLRHSILTQVVYAMYCVIQSLHKLCTQCFASLNPYTSCVRNVLRH